MGKIYRVQTDGRTVLAERKRASDERVDLQVLVENNLDLLLGEEIDPVDPRRWILIKDEMPVPSPETGVNLWSLDILVADQDAIPTLIECKLAKNGQSHREIIGQLFEYAANGRHYWTAEQLLRMATSTHTNLSAEIARLQTSWTDPEEYFRAVAANLRDARMRLVFLLDEAPQRLKMQLGFFHGRMPTIDLYVIELQQFHAAGEVLVSPYLIRPQDIEPRKLNGGKESASSPSSQPWDEPSFLAELASRVVDTTPVQKLLRAFESNDWGVAWGRGKIGAALLSLPVEPRRNFLNVGADGKLWLNFWVFKADEEIRGHLWTVLERIGRDICGVSLPDDLTGKGPSIPYDAWASKIDAILAVLQEAAARFRQ